MIDILLVVDLLGFLGCCFPVKGDCSCSTLPDSLRKGSIPVKFADWQTERGFFGSIHFHSNFSISVKSTLV